MLCNIWHEVVDEEFCYLIQNKRVFTYKDVCKWINVAWGGQLLALAYWIEDIDSLYTVSLVNSYSSSIPTTNIT